jgi:hypothetical protein
MGVEGGTVSGLPEVLEKDLSSSRSVLKSLAVISALTASGITGRVALQHFPSVEPVVPVAIAVGFYFNQSSGFASGFTGYAVTNFLVWGGHGPWSLFQCVGAGLAGSTGGYMAQLSESRLSFFGSMIAGTLAYEAVVNAGSLFFMPLSGSPLFLLGALPFVGIHLASSIGFGSILYGIRTDIRQFTRR